MAKNMDLLLGVLLIVLGALVLLGELGVGGLLSVMGVVLIIVGVLILLDVLAGGTLIGVVTLVLGLLLYLDILGVPRWAAQSINLIVGIVLLVMGALKVAGR